MFRMISVSLVLQNRIAMGLCGVLVACLLGCGLVFSDVTRTSAFIKPMEKAQARATILAFNPDIFITGGGPWYRGAQIYISDDDFFSSDHPVLIGGPIWSLEPKKEFAFADVVRVQMRGIPGSGQCLITLLDAKGTSLAVFRLGKYDPDTTHVFLSALVSLSPNLK